MQRSARAPSRKSMPVVRRHWEVHGGSERERNRGREDDGSETERIMNKSSMSKYSVLNE